MKEQQEDLIGNNPSEPSPPWAVSAWLFVIEGVKDHFKSLIGAGVFSVIVAVGLYIWSGQAAWLLPTVFYLVAFFAGIVITLLVLGFLGFQSILQTRRQAAEFAAGFISRDKGFFDYFVELDELQPQFANTVSAIGNEMTKMGEVSDTIDLLAWTTKGPKVVVDGLAKAARRLVRHNDVMSAEHSKLKVLLGRMTEATGHQVRSAFIDVNMLPPVRTALVELRKTIQNTHNAMTNWRTAQQNIYGMSQEMNTAVNNMVFVTDRILDTLQASDDRWSEQLEIIDSRLIES